MTVDTATLLLPGLLTVLLYAVALFAVVATRRSTLGPRRHPPPPRPAPPRVVLPPPRARPAPRLRVIEGGARRRPA